MEQQPSSWRAVYDLVRDTRADILREVAETKDEVAGLRARFDTHMLEHATKRGRGEAWATARVFVTTVLPIPAAVLAMIALVRTA